MSKLSEIGARDTALPKRLTKRRHTYSQADRRYLLGLLADMQKRRAAALPCECEVCALLDRLEE